MLVAEKSIFGYVDVDMWIVDMWVWMMWRCGYVDVDV
jgi:hypothetical protein